MRKPVLIFSLGAVLLSIGGSILRYFELTGAVDPDTGLYSFLPVSAALLALSAAALIFFALLSRSIKTASPADHDSVFKPATPLPVIISALSTAAMVYPLVAAFTDLRIGGSIVRCVLAVLAFLAAASLLGVDLSLLRGKKRDDRFFSLIIPVVFTCFLIIMFYKEYSAIPSLSAVMYDFLGLCSSAAAMYFLAGFSAGSGKAGLSLTCSGLAVFFCCVAITGAATKTLAIYYAFIILRLFKDSVLMCRNICSFKKAE